MSGSAPPTGRHVAAGFCPGAVLNWLRSELLGSKRARAGRSAERAVQRGEGGRRNTDRKFLFFDPNFGVWEATGCAVEDATDFLVFARTG